MLYKKFGFELRLLTKENGTEIFDLISPCKLDRTRGAEMYQKDRRSLKTKINNVLSHNQFNPIGIFKDDKLIGISFSNITPGDNSIWLGWLYIAKKYRKTKAFVLILAYLVNFLYKDMRIQVGYNEARTFPKLVKILPKIIGFGVIKDEVSSRLDKLCKIRI